MPWPEYPWSEPGNWYSQEGEALSGQTQGSLALGEISIAGIATTGNYSQSIDSYGSDIQHNIGAASTGQARQLVLALGAPLIEGQASIVQRGQSTSAAGYLIIDATGSSGQAQTLEAYGFKDPLSINVALQKLLEYPHSAVFDKSPEQELVLRIRGATSLNWSVKAGVLTVTVNGFAHKYALASLTFAALIDLMALDDIVVEYLNPAFSSLGSHMLLDAANDQDNSNGTYLYAYSAVLWALFASYSIELDRAQYSVGEALRQMIIGQANDEWLDLWGTLYDYKRTPGKLDIVYALEIPREAFRVRVNALAIEKAILELTGKDVRIEEPWFNMFRLDESQLSGRDRLYDGTSTGYHLIRPVSATPIDWDDVLSVIERNRAAGVKVLEPEVRLRRFVDGRVAGRIYIARTDTQSVLIPTVADGRLDYMQLSSGSFQHNYGVMISSISTFSVLGTGSPVSASMQYYNITGDTWRDRVGWGNSTWNGDGDADFIISAEGSVPLSWVIYDTETLEV